MERKDELSRLYLQQSELYKKVSKRHFRFLFDKIWFCWIFYGLVFLIIATFTAVQYVDYTQLVKSEKTHGLSRSGYLMVSRENLIEKINLSLLEITILLCFFAATFFVYVLAKETVDRFQIMKARNDVVAMDARDSGLMKIIETVAVKMNIPCERISVCKVLSRLPLPTIGEAGDKLYLLLIPPSFCTYARKHPQNAASVIAHEFGHVLQADTHLHLLYEVYFRIIKNIFLPVMVVGVFVQVYLFWKVDISLKTFPDIVLTFLPSIFLFGITLYDFKSLTRDHQQSELMADMAALIFLETGSLLNVLEEAKNCPNTPFFFRKNLSLRIRNLHQLAAKARITPICTE